MQWIGRKLEGLQHLVMAKASTKTEFTDKAREIREFLESIDDVPEKARLLVLADLRVQYNLASHRWPDLTEPRALPPHATPKA